MPVEDLIKAEDYNVDIGKGKCKLCSRFVNDKMVNCITYPIQQKAKLLSSDIKVTKLLFDGKPFCIEVSFLLKRLIMITKANF